MALADTVAAPRSDTMIVNMGPQHPSTHGVLRLELILDGENVVKCTPHIGYLHTGIEKEMETRNYQQCVTMTDRTDYLNPLGNNLGFALAVEKLFECEIPPRAQVARVLLVELQRIASHLVWLGTHELDLGAMTAFWYCFRERELLLDIFELCSGARLMTSYIRPGGLAMDLPPGFEAQVQKFLDIFPAKVDDYEALLTNNEIFIDRTKGIGYLTANQAIALGVTGPPLRASGVRRDIRKDAPYSGYETFDFDVPTATDGDVYARYTLRVAEMRQSHRIAQQALKRLPSGPFRTADRKLSLPPRDELYTSMESLIHHFKLVTEGIKPPAGEVYAAVESPRGELGYYIVSDGSGKPYRVHMRAPSFVNLQALGPIMEGRLIADAVACIGSLDPVLGEVDR